MSAALVVTEAPVDQFEVAAASFAALVGKEQSRRENQRRATKLSDQADQTKDITRF